MKILALATLLFITLALLAAGSGAFLLAGPPAPAQQARPPATQTPPPPCVLGQQPPLGCVDTDNDGLCDEWEIAGGVDLDGDGKIDDQHDLRLPGANPYRPDVYVQYDYM